MNTPDPAAGPLAINFNQRAAAMTAPIVAGTDGSEGSLAATAWAAMTATRRRVPLCIVHVADHHPGPPAHGQRSRHELAGPFRHELPHHARSALAKAAHRAMQAAPGVDLHAVAVYGHADQVLTAITARASLLVLGTRGAGGSPGVRLGSVASRLASQARCPVVFATMDGRPATRSWWARTVATMPRPCWSSALGRPTRGTPSSRRCTSGRIRRQTGSRAITTGCCLWRPTNKAAAALLSEQVAPWRHKYPGVLVTESTVHGNPGRVLVLASERADLIVVGARRGGLGLASALGPVADALLHHTQCPVAVIPGGE